MAIRNENLYSEFEGEIFPNGKRLISKLRARSRERRFARHVFFFSFARALLVNDLEFEALRAPITINKSRNRVRKWIHLTVGGGGLDWPQITAGEAGEILIDLCSQVSLRTYLIRGKVSAVSGASF